MERLWSYLRRFSRMTKEMRPAHRADILTHALLYYGLKTKQKLGDICGIMHIIHLSLFDTHCMHAYVALLLLKWWKKKLKEMYAVAAETYTKLISSLESTYNILCYTYCVTDVNWHLLHCIIVVPVTDDMLEAWIVKERDVVSHEWAERISKLVYVHAVVLYI